MSMEQADNSSPETGTDLIPKAHVAPTMIVGLNPRSCVTCSKRKVRCNRMNPCSNCSKAGIECVFPPPGRAPRRESKGQDRDVYARLRRLERLLQKIGVSPDAKDLVSETASVQRPSPGDLADTPPHQEEEAELESVADRFGKLIVDDDNSKFISPGLWSHLHAEIGDLKELLEPASDLEEEVPQNKPWDQSSDHGFFFGLCSSNLSMEALHPPMEQIPNLWQVYKENFDPMKKVLHAPTYEKKLLSNVMNLSRISRTDECIMFAIYLAAVVTLRPEECEVRFGPKPDLLRRYRFGVQQALARAEFLKTQSTGVLQAMIIYLLCLRAMEDDQGYMSSLGSVTLRTAQRLGLHRDGSHYENLTPFKQEIRRRLWWHAVMLENRFWEDLSFDPEIYDMMADTKLPRNLNDSDLYEDMKELPESRIGCTDMTFNLVVFENSIVVRKIHFIPTYNTKPGKVKSSQERKKMVEELTARIERKYFQNVDESIPIYWLVMKLSRAMLSKMWLTQCMDGGMNLSPGIRDKLFTNAISNLEFIALDFEKGVAARFSWLRPKRGLWHDTAFILSELCVRPTGPDVERAWALVRAIEQKHSELPSVTEGHLLKPLQRLMARAEAERLKADSERETMPDYTFFQGNLGVQQFDETMMQYSSNANAPNSASDFQRTDGTSWNTFQQPSAPNDAHLFSQDPFFPENAQPALNTTMVNAPPEQMNDTLLNFNAMPMPANPIASKSVPLAQNQTGSVNRNYFMAPAALSSDWMANAVPAGTATPSTLANGISWTPQDEKGFRQMQQQQMSQVDWAQGSW